jgi:hypothetical protein
MWQGRPLGSPVPQTDLQLNPAQNANRCVTGDQIVLDRAYPLRLLVEAQPYQLSRSLTFSDCQKIDNALTWGPQSPSPSPGSCSR